MFNFLLKTNIDKQNKKNILKAVNLSDFNYFINPWLKNGLTYEMILTELEKTIDRHTTYQTLPLVNMFMKNGVDLANIQTQKHSFLGIILKTVNHYDNNKHFKSFNSYENVPVFSFLKKLIAKEFNLTQFEMTDKFENQLTNPKVRQCYKAAKMLQEKRSFENTIIDKNSIKRQKI